MTSGQRYLKAICTFTFLICSLVLLEGQQVKISNKGQIDFINPSQSILIGFEAGQNSDPAPRENVAIGYQALKMTDLGTSNVACGTMALTNNIFGSGNVAIGHYCLKTASAGSLNTAVGASAMELTVAGAYNSAFGASAMQSNLGSYNSGFGYAALTECTIGSYNSAYGWQSQRNADTGNRNTSVGGLSLFEVSEGDDNTAIGYASGRVDLGHSNAYLGAYAGGKTSGTVNKSNNVMVGFEAGYDATGSSNVFLGYRAGKGTTTSNKLYIENSNSATPLIYGDFTTNTLEFNGQLQLKAAANMDAMIWDNGQTLLKNNSDAILSQRHIFRILLDTDNNNSGASGQARFQLYSNVDTSGSIDPKVNLNIDGGSSWINSGNMGIGLIDPTYKLDVAGVVNGSAGLSGAQTAFRAQGAEAIWFDGEQFSWGFGGSWNRFADSVRIGSNTAPSHLLQVDGVARSTQSTWATSSDLRVKKNISNISNATATLLKFRPVIYQWTDEYKTLHPELKEINYGFISQEVEQIIPSMVTTVREHIGDQVIEDFRVLNTDALIPLLVQTVQEQQARIDSQDAQIRDLQNLCMKMESMLNAMTDLNRIDEAGKATDVGDEDESAIFH